MGDAATRTEDGDEAQAPVRLTLTPTAATGAGPAVASRSGVAAAFASARAAVRPHDHDDQRRRHRDHGAGAASGAKRLRAENGSSTTALVAAAVSGGAATDRDEERGAARRAEPIPLELAAGEAGGEGSALADAADAAPTEPDADTFRRVPLENFGLRLMKGMGFNPDDGKVGVGSRARHVEAADSAGRPALLGLGAKPRADAGGAPWRANQRKHIVIHELVRFVDGPRRGKHAVVTQTDGVPGLSMVRLELLGERDDELVEVTAPRDQLELVPKAGADGAHPGYAVLAAYERVAARRAASAPAAPHSKPAAPPLGWLREGIMVKVVDERHAEYRRSGAVVMVTDPARRRCAVQMPGALLSDVPMDALQTVVPRRGAPAVVVAGPHAGERGVSLDTDPARQRAQVRLDADSSVRWLSYDDVSAAADGGGA